MHEPMIDKIKLRNRSLLAPMSGITDLPFRRLVHRLGAGLVVAEMVAGHQLAAQHLKTLQRVTGDDEIRPFVIQIAGRDPGSMADAARAAVDLGADMVDINMGCPARKVTKGLAGSALMQTPDLALEIIEAVVKAVACPVSLKMRLGWDDTSRNGAMLARQSEAAGIKMFAVHGRTRNQFYKGRADWAAIKEIVSAVDVPVFANGDILDFNDALECLAQSDAAGVMIGRGAQGRPWFVGQVGALLAGKPVPAAPDLEQRRAIVIEHYEDMLGHYGRDIGLRIARKHLGWYVDELPIDKGEAAFWRARLCRAEDPHDVVAAVNRLFSTLAPSYELAS